MSTSREQKCNSNSDNNNSNYQEPPDGSNSIRLPSNITASDVIMTTTSSSVGLEPSEVTYATSPAVRPRPRRRPPPPRRRNGTESSGSCISWRWSGWSSIKQQRRRSSATLSMIFQHRRRTFPPASRVLQKEKRRFTYGEGRANENSKKKSVRMKRRHSLAGILSTLKGVGSSSNGNSHYRSNNSNNNSNKYPSVRSSMVLHISDEDAAITDVPEILYDDYISTESMLSSQLSSCQYCNSNNNNNSNSSNLSNHISNYTESNSNSNSNNNNNNNNTSCPHRAHRHHPLRNTYINSHESSSASSESRPQRGRLYSEGSWFYSWVQHHPRRKKNKQPLLHKNNSGGNDTNNSNTKKGSVFIRPPTISSLSSLSNPLSKLDSIIHQNYPHRFSAFWFDTQGRSGKHHVEVDSKNGIAKIKQDSDHFDLSPSTVQSSMFLFGFLFFPLWWVGAWIYLRRPTRLSKQYNDLETQSLSFANPRVVGMLNCWMSCFSILIVPVIIGLAVWYHYALRNV